SRREEHGQESNHHANGRLGAAIMKERHIEERGEEVPRKAVKRPVPEGRHCTLMWNGSIRGSPGRPAGNRADSWRGRTPPRANSKRALHVPRWAARPRYGRRTG